MADTPTDQGSSTDWAQWVAYSALLSATASATVFETAWPLVGTMYQYQCRPGDIISAAKRWDAIASEFGACSADLERLTGGLGPQTWSGEDREQFDTRVAEYHRQLVASRVFATAVSIALVVIALLLYALIMFMAVIAAVLAVLLVLLIGCVAGVLTAAEAAEILVEADNTAYQGNILLKQSGLAVDVASHGLAAMLTEGMSAEVLVEMFSGDHHVGHDLEEGALNSAGRVVWGLLASAEQQLTGEFAGAGPNLAVPFGLENSYPDDKRRAPTVTEAAHKLVDLIDPPE